MDAVVEAQEDAYGFGRTEEWSERVEEVFADEYVFPINFDDVAMATTGLRSGNGFGEIATLQESRRKQDPTPHVNVTINGVKTSALLDSGAWVTVVSDVVWKRMSDNELKANARGLCTASGSPLNVIGTCHVEIEFDGRPVKLWAYVATNFKHELVLGVDFWELAGLSITNSRNELICSLGPGSRMLIPEDVVLSRSDEAQFNALIDHLLVSREGVLSRTTLVEHVIELVPQAKPFYIRSHHYSPAVEKMMCRELDRMLAMEVIEPSHSPVANPIIPVLKSDGTVRLCLDSRILNSMTVKDRFPVPNLPAILGRMEKAAWYASIDLKSAFWQIPLSDQAIPGQFATSRELTAFVFPGRGLYHFRVTPFGLCNSPATQCRLMHLALGHDLEPFVVIYLDDILIMAQSPGELLVRMTEVGKRLTKANLTVNLEKCKFFQKEIKFLGYFIGGGSIRADPKKVQAVVDYPQPRTAKEVRRFLGMAGYYRRLIHDFSGLTAPLSDLLKEDGRKFKWTEEAQQAYEALKRALTSRPVVQNPDFSLEFCLQCDASDTSAAAILGQRTPNGEIVIAYWSHKWAGSEKAWGATEKEAACVLLAVRHFREYIFRSHFTIVTDAKALTHLKTIKVDGSSRLARWALEMASYDVTIEHRAGKLNVVADALSRMVNVVEAVEGGEEDPWFVEMKTKIVQNPEHYPDFRLEGSRLLKFETQEDDLGGFAYVWKEYVPPRERERLVSQTHRQLGHAGWAKCWSWMKRQYFWPSMAPTVENSVRACNTCLHSKRRARNTLVPMGQSRNASTPFQMIAIDHWGPLPRSKKGHTYLLVVVDVLSKYVLLGPCRNATASPVVDFIERAVFMTFGVAEILLSDNARAYMGRVMMEFLNKYGVEHWNTPYHHPQANITERYVQTVSTAVRCMIFDQAVSHREWDEQLPQIQAALNALPNRSTKISPFKLNFGREMPLSGDYYVALGAGRSRVDLSEDELLAQFRILQDRAKTELAKAQLNYRHQYDKRTRVLKFEVHERVWRRNRPLSDAAENFSQKLAPKYLPALVLEIAGEDTYVILDEGGTVPSLYHANDLFKDRTIEGLELLTDPTPDAV